MVEKSFEKPRNSESSPDSKNEKSNAERDEMETRPSAEIKSTLLDLNKELAPHKERAKELTEELSPIRAEVRRLEEQRQDVRDKQAEKISEVLTGPMRDIGIAIEEGDKEKEQKAFQKFGEYIEALYQKRGYPTEEGWYQLSIDGPAYGELNEKGLQRLKETMKVWGEGKFYPVEAAKFYTDRPVEHYPAHSIWVPELTPLKEYTDTSPSRHHNNALSFIEKAMKGERIEGYKPYDWSPEEKRNQWSRFKEMYDRSHLEHGPLGKDPIYINPEDDVREKIDAAK